jgi:saccharopine dehydrogenase-like NADP-dependent oxidoreductase
MKKIVVFGAGLSATYLIAYLEANAAEHNWNLTVIDQDLELAKSKCRKTETTCMQLDIMQEDAAIDVLQGASLAVSMLPAHLHIVLAKFCLKLNIHLATASYLSEEIKALNTDVQNANLIFLNECGLDPGIDHLSAMRLLNGIRKEGGEITEFESFTGGLVAPECEDNPWKYKFTWNPRNVVLAGSGGAVKFIHNNQYKYIPYHKVFRRTEIVEIPDYGKFEGYANRDSLKYRETYGLTDVQTMYRGTFRRPGFSKAWHCFVELGATDDSFVLEHSEQMTNRDFINTFLAFHPTDSIELKLKQYLRIDQDDVDLWERLESTGIFDKEIVGIKNATPAQMLQKILEKKWTLKETDRDMIVMWHRVNYIKAGKKHTTESSLVCEGIDKKHTAMAKTVGLPLAMACKLILTDSITQRGCILPITPEFYTPILSELETEGIVFNEVTVTE